MTTDERVRGDWVDADVAAGEPSRSAASAAPSHAERARTLIATLPTGTLCTLTREPEGFPYGSLVAFALEASEPIFLLSGLAEHTRNLLHDARASLLAAEHREGDPLAGGRVTLLGTCVCVPEDEREQVSRAYLERHPEAAQYAAFRDFAFWRLQVSGVRYIGGYGRMSWIEPDAWRAATPDPLAPDAAAILEHMNQDHADALPAYCRAFAGVRELSRAHMIGIDRLGFEMAVESPAGTHTVRVAFHESIASKTDARKALVGLLKEARTKLAGDGASG